jgi:hypothetical protein
MFRTSGSQPGCRAVLPAQCLWVVADISSLATMTHCAPTMKASDDRSVVSLPGGSSLEGGGGVMVAISLEQSAAGNWRVCRCRITLFSDLQLEAAIKLAQEMARDEHQRLRRQVQVEMPGSVSTIELAQYADDEGKSNAADALAA